ncbi:prevent-host-death family protein [Corynebacterium phoceense]|nr:prevent-host-death family protein [Corynebacterium phoceense]MCQ9337157.1 prevent-host-death family protein [Corynebacterium phoceense]
MVRSEPVVITSRGSRTRAVVVSPDFCSRAFAALEAQEEVKELRQAVAASKEHDEISHEDLKKELGLL